MTNDPYAAQRAIVQSNKELVKSNKELLAAQQESDRKYLENLDALMTEYGYTRFTPPTASDFFTDEKVTEVVDNIMSQIVMPRAEEVDYGAVRAFIKSQVKMIPRPKDGRTPTKEELMALIAPLIPEAKPGKDGKDFVLTDKQFAKRVKDVIKDMPKDHILSKSEIEEMFDIRYKQYKQQQFIGSVASIKSILDVNLDGLQQDADGKYILGSGSGSGGGPAMWGNIGGNLADQADLVAALAGKANTSHTHTKSEIADFDDADYATAAQGATADSAVQPAQIANFETTTQLNTRDTNNRNRANHTGTQPINSVSGLQGELNAKVAVTDIVNDLTTTVATVPLSAAQGKVLKDLIDNINTVLASDEATLDTLQEIVDYIELNRDSLENLTIASIAGLQTALDNKSNVGHTHVISEVTGLQAELDGKVDDSQVQTNVPAGAVFTDTVYDDTAVQAALGNKLENVVEDTTPQLGGDLDGQGNNATNLGNVESETMLVEGEQSGGVMKINRTPTAAQALPYGTQIIKATHDGDMPDGFGVAQQFAIEDNTSGEQVVANIQAVREGADNSAFMNFVVAAAGVLGNAFTLFSDKTAQLYGDLLMGGNHIGGLADPEFNDDAATKGYVDTEIAGVSAGGGITSDADPQANLAGTASAGDFAYDTTDEELQRFDGTNFVAATPNETATGAIAAGSTLGLEQALLANAGQPGLTVLAVGYSTSGKVQGTSLGDGNVVQVYANGADYSAGVVLYRELMSLGEPIVFTGLANGAIITATQGFYGFSEQVDGSKEEESPMPLLSYGLSFKSTFFFGFRNCNFYNPGGTGANQGWVHVVNGPLKSTVALKFGNGNVVQGQSGIELEPWEYRRLYTDGDTEYILEGTNPIMACHNAHMDLQPHGRFYDSRLIMPLTNDGITWPRSGFISAPFDNTQVDFWVRDGAEGRINSTAGTGVSPGSPVDFDAAIGVGTGASDIDYEPDGATRVKAIGLISAYSGADSAGAEASPLMPVSAMSQVVAQPQTIVDSGDGGNSGIAIASPYVGTAKIYSWNGTGLTLEYTVPLNRNGVTVTSKEDQNHPAAGMVANETVNGAITLTGTLGPGIIIADVPITVIIQSDVSGTTTIRSQNGTTATTITNDDDETLSLGITPPELKAEITEGEDGILYRRSVTGGTETWNVA